MGLLWWLGSLLCWGAVGVFNLWIWQKTKALSHLLMMIGSFAMAAYPLLMRFGNYSIFELAGLISLAGLVCFSYGFFLLVRPQVQDQLNALKERATSLASADGEKDAGGDS